MRKVLLTGLLGMGIAIGTAAAAEIEVKVAPPKAVVEHRPPAPGPHYVWIGGYHRWDGHGYVWEPGRWERPPREHAVWVAPRWQHHGDHWVFVEGRWR